MKVQRLVLITLVAILSCSAVAQQPAQQPARIKRPVKNPPQYPSIIDLDNKDTPEKPQQNQTLNPQDQLSVANQGDSLVQALSSLTGEVRTLVQEIRSLNLRQQAQLDMLRMTRTDMRIDHFERELRPVRERIAALETDEQGLYQLMTRESLFAQTANLPTLNRDQSMNQLKQNYEVRLRFVQAEKERHRKIESDLLASLKIYQNQGSETENRIQATEEMLKRIESAAGKTERKP
ncbi:MAG: hypothetical protein L0220_25425 [Acidobacteria bacterium]|nr:hypothetical protein [Acidobacteriota bacterium]